MTIGEIIQRIQSLYSKGIQSDDSRLSSRHIYNKMLSTRSRLITQKANKNQYISQWNYQTIDCIELIIAPQHDCPCIPDIGCNILRTKYKLPKPLLNLNDSLIKSVTSIDGTINYTKTTWENKKYKKGNKYTSSKPDYFIKNNYLYITDRKASRIVTITGLFDDPIEVSNYKTECNNKISHKDLECECILDKEFPIDSDLIEPLIDICKEELLVQFSQGIEDITNDTKDNLLQQTK